MAKRQTSYLVCDPHGKVERPAVSTIEVKLDGQKVKKDLCAEHTAQVRKLLGIGGPRRGRKVTAASKNGTKSAARRGRSQLGPVIRKWANENGWDLPQRGRIPAEVTDAWEKATGESAN